MKNLNIYKIIKVHTFYNKKGHSCVQALVLPCKQDKTIDDSKPCEIHYIPYEVEDGFYYLYFVKENEKYKLHFRKEKVQ